MDINFMNFVMTVFCKILPMINKRIQEIKLWKRWKTGVCEIYIPQNFVYIWYHGVATFTFTEKKTEWKILYFKKCKSVCIIIIYLPFIFRWLIQQSSILQKSWQRGPCIKKSVSHQGRASRTDLHQKGFLHHQVQDRWLHLSVMKPQSTTAFTWHNRCGN